MANNANGQQRAQQGAVLVEFAVTVSFFMVLTLGIMEFVLLLFDMSRANEMTRQLSRLAITADPVCDVWGAGCDGASLSCPGGSAVTVNLSQVDTGTPSGSSAGSTGYRMLQQARLFLPDVAPSQIEVTYACSGTGNALRPQPIVLVTVRLQNYDRKFLLAGLLGLSNGIGFPAFEVTRLGEDLYTEG